MKDVFRFAAATPRVALADPDANAEAILALLREAEARGVQALVFPELCLTGASCGDLFRHRLLADAAEAALARIVRESAEMEVLFAVGLPLRAEGGLYNCAAVVHRGKVLGLIPKAETSRWFSSPAPGAAPVSALGPLRGDPVFDADGVKTAVAFLGAASAPEARLLLVPGAPPELVGHAAARREQLLRWSKAHGCALALACAGDGESTTDMVYGAHDLLACDGALLAERRFETGLLAAEADGALLRAAAKPAPEGKATCEVCCPVTEAAAGLWPLRQLPFVPEDETARAARCAEVFNIQVCGLRRRAEHVGAKRFVVGVSGGLDSTLALLVCAETARKMGLPADALLAVTMPCFGTTARTKSNAQRLSEGLGADFRTVDIRAAVQQHFRDIGHDENDHSVVFENAQARERTQVVMDLANGCGGLAVGTGDLSELALGWATFNGDHMSMYGVNGGVPKTLIRHVVRWYAEVCGGDALRAVLLDILDTPVSPELLPAENGEISQKTEDIVGPYELHDFFLYHFLRHGCTPKDLQRRAEIAFRGVYDRETIRKWLQTFLRRFFAQQFKRSCLPDGPKVGSVSLSPRGDWSMPSDAMSALWLRNL